MYNIYTHTIGYYTYIIYPIYISYIIWWAARRGLQTREAKYTYETFVTYL